MFNLKEYYLKHKKRSNKLDINIDIIKTKLKSFSFNEQHNYEYIYIDNYVVKCIGIKDNIENDNEYITKIEKINKDLEQYFPKFYKWNDDNYIKYIEIENNPIKYAKCLIIERLDDNLIEYILKEAYQKAYGNLDEYDFLYKRLLKTVEGYVIDETEKYKQMIDNMRKYILELCISFNIRLIYLHHNLIKKGWIYNEYKFNSIGYKNSKLYLMDDIIGLSKISNEYFTEYLNLNFVNYPLGNYNILEHYNLKFIFGINFNDFYPKFDNKNLIIKLTKLKYNKEKEDEIYNWILFKKNGQNNFIVIQFIMGFYRLVIFDDYQRHMSNYLYNNIFQKIDDIFESIELLYNKLETI